MRDWLQLRLMPYSVGAVASVVIGLSFLSLLFSGGLRSGPFSDTAGNGDPSVLLASNRHTYNDDVSQSPILQSDYARGRLAFASESPSVNPQGALIALTRSLCHGGMKNDEMVVVADVFSNGLAQIAEVVEPSRDRRAVGELEKALDSDPSYAPFVPGKSREPPRQRSGGFKVSERKREHERNSRQTETQVIELTELTFCLSRLSAHLQASDPVELASCTVP
jgi:hypothetical protein